jgi:CelD/BcsL family acetyltransferase involved in cellulose biosynthesis
VFKDDQSPYFLLLEHLSVDVVTTTANMEALKNQWERLSDSTRSTTLFQGFAWNYAWWKIFGNNYSLSIITVYEEGVLVGLAPFTVQLRFGVPHIQPIGANQYAYFGLLVETGRQDVVQAIADKIRQLYPCGLIHFPYYNMDDFGVSTLGGALNGLGWREVRWRRHISHFIYEPKGYESYEGTKSSKSRSNLKRARKRLEAQDAVTVTHHRGSEVDDQVVQRMARIQKISWLARRDVPNVDSAPFRFFISALAKAGMAEVFLLRLGERDIAFILNYCWRESSYCISIGFDETLEHLSPGKILMNACVQTILERGVNIYDFFFGDAEYKRFWANRTTLVFRSVYYRGFRSYLLSWFPHRLHGRLKKYEKLRALNSLLNRWKKRLGFLRQSSEIGS